MGLKFCSRKSAAAAFWIDEPAQVVYNQAAMMVAAALPHSSAAMMSSVSFSAPELLGQAIVAIDLKGRITYWNAGAETLYQWRLAEVLGQPFRAIMLPAAQRQQVTRKVLARVLAQGYWQGTVQLCRKDDSRFLAAVTASLLTNACGEAIGFMGIAVAQEDADPEAAMLMSAAIVQPADAKYRQAQVALQTSQAELAKREAYLATLVAVQRQLLIAPTDLALFTSVLEPLGQAVAASRVYVFVNSRDLAGNLTMSQRAEWCATAMPTQLDNPALQNLAYAPDYSRWETTLTQGQPIVGNVAEFPEPERQLLLNQAIASILLLPLLVRSQFFGFIGFACCQAERRWEAPEINLLSAAAAAISLALEHRQAEETLRKQAERERLLSAIAARVRQSLDLDEILDRTVAEVRQVLQTDRVLIYRFDTAGCGNLVAASLDPDWCLETSMKEHRTWYRDTQAVYEHGLSYLINDVTQHGLPPDYLAFMQLLQVQAKMVVPILHHNQLWGVLTVHHCAAPRQWQPFEVDLLEQLAIQVAIALQQAQLFQQVQQQAQRERLLNQISRALNSSLDPAHILQEIVNRTGECFGVDRVLIFIINGQLHVRQEWRVNAQIPSMLTFSTPISELPDLIDPQSDFFQHHAYHAPDFAQEGVTPTRQMIAEQLQTKSVLSVPIFIRERLFGMLALNTVTACRTFTADEIQLLQRIADQAAIALYNAQSYERLEQEVQERTCQLEQEKRVSEAASRAKSEFLATMSHELRTPLNAILGLSYILEQQFLGSLTSKQAEYVSHIHASGEHLLQLINDILDLAKVEAGRETLTLAPVSVPQVCEACLNFVREQAVDRGLRLLSQLDPQVQTCIADERRLRQMLLNLLSNAVKFTPTGEVALIVAPDPQGIRFTVADTGIGIAPEKLSLLFQPFSQLDSQLNRQYPGTGLGLVLTRNLAQLHGGDVTVESVLGQGSRFTLRLPDLTVAELMPGQAATTTPPEPNLCSSSTTGRILIVEDDDDSALLLQDYLCITGHRVDRLADGRDFLPRVRSFQPDLVLLDVQLPNAQTGLELLNTLRQQPDLCQVPVVIVTAMAMTGDREKFLAAGANDYLSKPLEIPRLEAILWHYL